MNIARRYLSRSSMLIVLCVITSSCRRDIPTIWRSELKSPDGAWLAIAHTEQDGGFGSAYIGTFVDLESTDATVNNGKPFTILSFDCPGPAAHAYVLDPANAGGTIGLQMRWLDPSHLDVTYDGKANVILQVAKFSNVSISLRDLSKNTP